jgi:hypothetical protein
MTTDELKRLLDIVCSGDKNAVREAGKKIKKLRIKFPDNQKELLDVYKKALLLFDEISPEGQTALASLLSIFGWYAKKVDPTLADFAFRAMQNENGQTREMARRGADTLRLSMFYDNEKDSQKLLVAHLERIEALFPKYKNCLERYVEKIPVSVYKTLITYWWDSVRGITGDQIGASERAKKLEIPVPQYLDDDWHEQEENQVDDEKVRDNLWRGKKNGDPKRAEKFFRDLDERARAYFQKSLAHFNIPHTAIRVMEEQLKKEGDEIAPMILMQLIGDVLKYTKGTPDLSKMNPLARGFQFFLNHRLQKNADGKPVSELLVQCIVTREMEVRHVPSDMAEFIEKIAKTHDEIDAFAELLTKTRRKFFRNDALKTEYRDLIWNREKRDIEFCESAHYAFDWYATTEPWTIAKRTPRQLAAISWCIIQEINEEGGMYGFDWNMNDLAKFGGWKTASGIGFTGKIAARDVRNAMADPDLLLISERERGTIDEDDDFLVGSPLGVKNNMARYFAVLSTEYGFGGDEWERLTKAINDAEEEKLLINENLECHDNYALLKILCPFTEAPGKILDNIIIAANENKPFLRFHHLITNTRRPRISEIREYLSEFEE